MLWFQWQFTQTSLNKFGIVGICVPGKALYSGPNYDLPTLLIDIHPLDEHRRSH